MWLAWACPGCVAVLSVAGVNYDNASHELAAPAKALRVPLLPITVADWFDRGSQVSDGLSAGGKEIRTLGPAVAP